MLAHSCNPSIGEAEASWLDFGEMPLLVKIQMWYVCTMLTLTERWEIEIELAWELWQLNPEYTVTERGEPLHQQDGNRARAPVSIQVHIHPTDTQTPKSW